MNTIDKKCAECNETKGLKRGWTLCWYCSERCEKIGVAACHASMPGGLVPNHPLWMPDHIRREIEDRWRDKH